MKSLRIFILGFVLASWAPDLFAAPVDDLLAAVKKEGTFEFYGPSTLTPQGAQALNAAFNKKIRPQYQAPVPIRPAT